MCFLPQPSKGKAGDLEKLHSGAAASPTATWQELTAENVGILMATHPYTPTRQKSIVLAHVHWKKLILIWFLMSHVRIWHLPIYVSKLTEWYRQLQERTTERYPQFLEAWAFDCLPISPKRKLWFCYIIIIENVQHHLLCLFPLRDQQRPAPSKVWAFDSEYLKRPNFPGPKDYHQWVRHQTLGRDQFSFEEPQRVINKWVVTCCAKIDTPTPRTKKVVALGRQTQWQKAVELSCSSSSFTPDVKLLTALCGALERASAWQQARTGNAVGCCRKISGNGFRFP